MKRANVLLTAVAILLVTGLVVTFVSVGRWSYRELRQQAQLSPVDRPTVDQPAVIGPAAPSPSMPADAGPPAGAIISGNDPPSMTAAPPSGAGRAGAAALAIPVDGVEPGELYPSFAEVRGERTHEAIDIMAPRGTPVRAVAAGRIAKLFTSDAGGLTIYQFDEQERVAYYYAHLDRYAPTLTEGDTVQRGDVIGYVGSTGNASAEAPHLHFAVFALGPEKRWWEGQPVDPYPLLGGPAR